MKKASLSLKTVSFVFVVLLGSCQNKNSEKANSDSYQPDGFSEPPHAMGTGPLALRAEAVGLEKPHHYQVKLSWSIENPEPSTLFLIQRQDWNESRVVTGGQNFYLDAGVEEGKEYFYLVKMLNGSKGTSSDRINVSVPKDRVFEKGEHLVMGSLEGYQRIFFLEEAKIFWNGENLTIRANEIISENAVFESFSEDQKTAMMGQLGKSGGHLIIKAKLLTGSLFIRADGQMGGQGETGLPGKKGAQGDQGPVAFLYWGKPGETPDGAHIHAGYWFVCNPPRLPGGKGKTGETGGAGKRGLKGGNSGKVHVEIGKANDGDVYFTNRPGAGGEGGLGGAGGEGGPGGIPGPIDWETHSRDMPPGANLDLFHQCAPVLGEKGDEGLQGPRGAKGEDGFQAPVCLKLGDSQTGQCP